MIINAPVSALPDPIERLVQAQNPLRLTLWMLRLDGEGPRYRFVHGHVIAARPGAPIGTWSRFNADNFLKRQSLFRYSVGITSDQLGQIARALISGATFSVALESAGLGHLDLGDSDLTTTTFNRLPTAYFPPKNTLADSSTSRLSPCNDAGCYCARLVRPNRFAFLPGSPSDATALLKRICASMDRETGLAFSGDAGDAFGQLEVYWLPSLNEYEESNVELLSHRPLHLRLRNFPTSNRHAIHIRCEQVSDTAFDELFILDPGVNELTVTLPEPNDGIAIRIWTQSEHNRWELWHDNHTYYLREIDLHASLVRLTGNVGAQWLEQLPKRLSEQVEHFTQITQVTPDSKSTVGSRQSWETDILEARRLVSRLTPPASRSRFFHRGWGTNENKLDFATWLKDQLSRHSGTIILTDPYFDLLGLDLVCRASGAAKKLVVLTCSQVPSLDDTKDAPRAERLRRHATKLHTILRGIRLHIYDLRSSNSDSSIKQHFHDRYLLLFDDHGNPVDGYNLSTSLQSAATTSPLLVTEIPADVLGDVAEYVHGLMHPDDNSGFIAHTIYPTEQVARSASDWPTDERNNAIASALVACERAPDHDHALALIRSSADPNDKARIVLTDTETDRLVAHLHSKSINEAAEVWEGMVAISLANSYGGLPDLLRNLIHRNDVEATALFLIQYLDSYASGDIGQGTATHTKTLSHVLNDPFRTAIRRAASFYDHHHELPIGTTWPIWYAVRLLACSSARHFSQLVSVLRAKKASAERTVDLSVRGSTFSPAAHTAVEQAYVFLSNVEAILSAATSAITWSAQLRGPGLGDDYAGCSEPFARALWAFALWRKVERGDLSSDLFCSKLSLLDAADRRLVLAYVVYELRIELNRAKSRGEDATRPLPNWLVEAISEAAGDSCNIDELIALVELYSGPLAGNWSKSTHVELLQPLIERGQLSMDTVFSAWDRVQEARAQQQLFGPSDFELVQVWGHCVWGLTEDQRLGKIASYGKWLKRIAGTLSAPFLRSRDYTRWSRGVHDAAWLLLRAWAIQRACPAGADDSASRNLLRNAYALAVDERLADFATEQMKGAVDYALKDSTTTLDEGK